MATEADKVEMRDACLALRAGEVSENEFVRRTAGQWARAARYLWGKWRRSLPAWVEPEDVEQVLLLKAIYYAKRWKPARKMPINAYVVWASVKRAQRAMNGWRGATTHGNSGKAPGRPEKVFSRAFSPDEDPLARLGSTPASQDEEVERAERLAAALDLCETTREVVVVRALWASGGCPKTAAALIAGDLAARLECSVRSEASARKAVLSVMEALARRASAGVDRDLPVEAEEDVVAEECPEATVASAAA